MEVKCGHFQHVCHKPPRLNRSWGNNSTAKNAAKIFRLINNELMA
jgi:hypothetical protein